MLDRFDRDDLAEIAANIEAAPVEHQNPTRVEPALRDTDDDYLVALAREARAD